MMVLSPARLVRFLALSKPNNMYIVQCILDHVVLLAFIDLHSFFHVTGEEPTFLYCDNHKWSLTEPFYKGFN